MKCICVICGKEFEAARKTAVCSDQCKKSNCVVCGKEFIRNWPYNSVTCSSKCRGTYRKESGAGKDVAEKARQTLKMRYGVSNPAEIAAFSTRKCAWCGKEYVPNSNSQKWCEGPHYGHCPVCGKITQIKDMSTGPKACSEECRIARINETCLQKYGAKDAVNSEHAKAVAKIHNLEKYGVDHYSKTQEYKDKYTITCLQRFGATSPLKNDTVKSKVKTTNLERRGVEWPMSDDEVKSRAASTLDVRYGGAGFASELLRNKMKQTNLNKYGVSWPSMSEDVKEKIAHTIESKYGAPTWFQCKERYERTIVDPDKVDNWIAFKDDPKNYISTHYTAKPTVKILCRDLGVTDTPIYDVMVRTGTSYLVQEQKWSTMEYEVHEFLEGLQLSDEVLHNARGILNHKELDFYIPSRRFAIECNPTATHNSSFPDPWNQPAKSPSYHKAKSVECESRGIFLFHIFGYDWTHRRPVIESMLKSCMGLYDVIYRGRNTYVCEISNAECTQFLHTNHERGKGNFPVRLGLRLKDSDELVSVMTFSRKRKTIGTATDGYELARFCNKLGCTVTGGASKLFKHFVSAYQPSEVISYSDVATTRGGLYQNLGFMQETCSSPNYVWVSIEDDSRVNRLNAQKSNIRKFLKDEAVDLTKTEKQIMEEHGYARVYDSGTVRWRYKA